MASGFIHVIKSVWLLGFMVAQAQDTVSLRSIEITAPRSQIAQLGKKTETLDSTLQQQFKFGSVADALNLNSTVFIKSYGPGGIASTAFRGGNASQTAVLWNGFNLQNAMLGQSDLALMPSVLFEQVEVEYGGSSSLWGSGAVGGSIHLNTKTPFNAGLITTTNLGGASFGGKSGSTRVFISKRRFISSTKLYGLWSDNNYTYKDTSDREQPLKRQKNAGYTFKGLMQEFKFLLGTRHLLSLNAWINDNDRHLPASNPSLLNKTYQQDQALRLTVGWNYSLARFRSVTRLALFHDRIDYTDSLISLFSKSKVQTYMVESDNYWRWHSNHQLNIGLSGSASSALTGNYKGRQSIGRLSILAGNRFSFFENKLSVYVSVRAEYFSVGTLPVTGNIGAEYKLFKRIVAKLNVGRVYRQPTLNELYWLPGGNTNLKPEQGYTAEGELGYSKSVGNLSLFISGAAYSRKINDWILWVPGPGGNPAPINVQQVWSRGTETTWRLTYHKNKWDTQLGVITGYVLSTVESNGQENSNTLHKQLVYTPRYTVNGHLSLAYGPVRLVFFHQYIGYRFITSDNTQWLEPYHVSSLKLNYALTLKKIKLALFGAANNLFNTSYATVAGRPMPLSNYELGITIQTKHNLKNN